jgi:hypothetical protein
LGHSDFLLPLLILQLPLVLLVEVCSLYDLALIVMEKKQKTFQLKGDNFVFKDFFLLKGDNFVFKIFIKGR